MNALDFNPHTFNGTHGALVSEAAGKGRLEVDVVFGESTATTAWASSPLKLLTPCARGPGVWAFTTSFGGGMVAGDQTCLEIRVGTNARCFVGTQSSTKVYRNPARLPCSHTTAAVVEEGGLLIFAPDPVQAFAESAYNQQQEFQLAAGAGLVLLDWFTSGRAARGERWAFANLRSRNDVFIDGERAFVDSVAFDPTDAPLTSPHRTGRFNCFATLLFIGAPLRSHASTLLADISARPIDRRGTLVSSASPIREGAVLRIAAESVEDVGRELHRHLKPLAAFLGDDPWERKW